MARQYLSAEDRFRVLERGRNWSPGSKRRSCPIRGNRDEKEYEESGKEVWETHSAGHYPGWLRDRVLSVSRDEWVEGGEGKGGGGGKKDEI